MILIVEAFKTVDHIIGIERRGDLTRWQNIVVDHIVVDLVVVVRVVLVGVDAIRETTFGHRLTKFQVSFVSVERTERVRGIDLQAICLVRFVGDDIHYSTQSIGTELDRHNTTVHLDTLGKTGWNIV